MDKKEVIGAVAKEVRKRLEGEPTGHDWWHAYRVWQMAKRIGREERADMFVVEVSALLHDIADYKFNHGDHSLGPRVAGEILKSFGVADDIVSHVKSVIEACSFLKDEEGKLKKTIEAKVVQDADRLDALGAIGIARAFATGAKFGEIFHDPQIKATAYNPHLKNRKGAHTVINHFYEKLLIIKSLMNTKTAKRIAARRHKFLEIYLDKFFKEWEGRE